MDSNRPGPVLLRVFDNDIPVGEFHADGFREDLKAAGVGDGRYAFSWRFPHALAWGRRHVIDVRRADNGQSIEGSPKVLEPEGESNHTHFFGATPATWRGCIDKVARTRIEGWAWDPRDPNSPLSLLVLDNGEVIGRVLANQRRDDLAKVGIGNGRHAFTFLIPGGLIPAIRHVVQVIGEVDGCEMPGSPVVVEACASFDRELQSGFAAALSGLVSSEEREVALNFLADQIELLLAGHADAESCHEARFIHHRLMRRWGGGQPDAMGDLRRALVIDTLMPAPDQDAGSNAILSHMQALQTLGYDVSFVATEALAPPLESRAALEAMGIHCCRLPFFASVEEVLRRQTRCFDLIYVHRLSNAVQYLGLAHRYGGRARIVYSVADLHFLRFARQASVLGLPRIAEHSVKLRQAELNAASGAHIVMTHSSVEADLLRKAIPRCNVHVIPWAVPVRSAIRRWNKRSDLAFVGNFGHTPNPDAAQFLVRNIMPRVWQQQPAVKCLLVGSHLVDSVSRLAGPGVEVRGYVSDLSSILDGIRLTVAPLRFGAGVKGKVLESLAAGVPCVMSPTAAEGIPLTAELESLVVTDEEAMAALITRLVTDDILCEALSRAALAFIASNYSEVAVVSAIAAAIVGQNERTNAKIDRKACSEGHKLS